MSIASRAKQKANDPTDEEKRRDYWARRSSKITLRKLQPLISAMFMSALHRRHERKVVVVDDTGPKNSLMQALAQRKLPLP